MIAIAAHITMPRMTARLADCSSRTRAVAVRYAEDLHHEPARAISVCHPRGRRDRGTVFEPVAQRGGGGGSSRHLIVQQTDATGA